MKKYILLFVLAVSTILTYSQNNPTAISVQELLQGKWQSIDDKTNFLIFEKI
jgi:hypothetical protein